MFTKINLTIIRNHNIRLPPPLPNTKFLPHFLQSVISTIHLGTPYEVT